MPAHPTKRDAARAETEQEDTNMEYRQLGESGLRVSCLTLGTMSFGGRGPFRDVGQTDLEGARRQIDRALDAGVNLIDTADMYSAGAAESILGRALNGRRHEVLIASKARFPMGPGPNDAGLSRHHLIEACEASLRRLGTDHIDLYQVHEWDGLTPLEETLAALDHLLQSGKVRYVGCSNFGGWQVMKALGIADRAGLPRFVSQQVYLSLQERSAEYEIVPSAIDQGLGLLIWSPLAGGLLSGKYRRGEPAPPGSRRAGEWAEPPVYDEDKLFDTVEMLVEIAEDGGVSPSRVALAWLLRRPGITTVIVGARNDEQLADNLAAVELELSEEEINRLEAVSRPQLIYPFWHQRNTAAERLSPADLSLIGPHLPHPERKLAALTGARS
jgi:aryl-alcohol dehydrogenase-like predicted oxidoreductase